MNHDIHDPLREDLAAWRVEPPNDPNFRPAVFARIRQSWAGYLRHNLLQWSAVAAIALIAAGWAGRELAQSRLDAQREQLVVSYLGNLEPRVLAKSPHPSK